MTETVFTIVTTDVNRLHYVPPPPASLHPDRFKLEPAPEQILDRDYSHSKHRLRPIATHFIVTMCSINAFPCDKRERNQTTQPPEPTNIHVATVLSNMCF